MLSEIGWVPKNRFEKGLEITVKWNLQNYDQCREILKKSDYNCERIVL